MAGVRWTGVVCVALATGLAASGAVALPYGVNAHIPSPGLLATAAEMGAEWVRIDMTWDTVERTPGTYDWSTYDRLVDAAEANGLRIYATLSSTPAWATTGAPSSGVPSDPRTWYEFCFRAAQRYRGRIEHFGLWNEPNVGRFWAGDRAQYVEIILKTGSRAVRDANPRAQVCGPELAHLGSADWDGWLSYVLTHASDALDVVTHHVYPSGSDPASVIQALNRDQRYPWEPRSVSEVLRKAGWPPRPFWLTETGYDSGSPGTAGEAAQALFLASLLSQLLGPNRSVDWVEKVFIYELSDDPNSPDGTFGLVGPPPDHRRKPAYDTYVRFAATNAVDDAEVVSAALPTVLRPGERVVASVSVRNTGTTTWNETAGYRLGAVGDHDAFASTRQLLAPGEAVGPGALATFTFPFLAPATVQGSGQSYPTQWRMVREGTAWFGQARAQSVTVTAGQSVSQFLYVPALANTAGLNGTRWRSDLTLFNAGPELAELAVALLEQGPDNSSPRTAGLTVPPGSQQRLADVLAALFDLTGAATLRLDVVRGNVIAAGKSYTSCGGGTCGQAIPALPSASAVAFGDVAALRGLAHSADRGAGSRTNVGLLNPTSKPITVLVDLFAEAASEAGSVFVDLPPYGFRQLNDVFRAVGAPDITSGSAAVQTLTPDASVLAWATVVDNVSGEPTFVAPSSPTDEPLVIVTAAHNDGLQGSRWRSDLELFNPGASPVELDVELLPAGAADRPPAAVVGLSALDGALLPDVLSSLFGFEGSAALRVTPRAGVAAAFSTTYNAASPGSPGQAVPAARQSEAAVLGEEVRLLSLSGSADRTTGFRTNIGFVNVSGRPITVEVALYRSPSTPVGTLTAALAPLEWRQITDVFRLVAADVDDGFAVVRTTTPGGRFLAYASVVDNASGDPVLVQGR